MSRSLFALFAFIAVAGLALMVAAPDLTPLPGWLTWTLVGIAAGLAVHELLGRPVPFFRWSFLRLAFGMKTLLREWQVGDGREEDVALYVLSQTPSGDLSAAIRAIDEYATRRKFLINVGDRKGAILDAAIARVRPMRVVELGAYVGYSALRIARALPEGGHLFSIELNPANAEITRRILKHAGAESRVTVVVGSLGDEGKTLNYLKQTHDFGRQKIDLVFVDHAKEAYLPDLQRVLDAGWLRQGSVVIADNVGFPGAPEYRAYMEAEEGKRWRTQGHKTFAEYQHVIPDLVLESTLLRS